MKNDFSFVGGDVSFINNGFEIIPENPLASFLSLCNINKTVIKNVNFSMNVFSGANSKLLNISRFYSLELSNLNINYHLSSSALITINQTNLSQIINFSPQSINSQHILIKNVSISNVVSTSLIEIIYVSSCPNILITDSIFQYNDLINSLIKYSITSLEPTCIDGQITTNPVLPQKRLIELKNLKFLNNFSMNLISFEKAGNLEMNNLEFNGNNFGSFNGTTLVIDELKKNSGC